MSEPVTLDPERLDELERVMCRVPSVTAARAVLGLSGEIAEVHVITSNERSPKLVVRDIQSVAKAMFDLEIDYRRVSVVQMESQASDQPTTVVLDPEPAGQALPPPEPEPVPMKAAEAASPDAPKHVQGILPVEPSISRVVISQSGALTEVEVHLAGPGRDASCSVRGPSSQVIALAARAALGAREALGADDAAAVAGVEETVVGGRRVVVVAALVAGPAGEVFTTACAPVTGSVAEAAAAAVLQAVAGRVG